MSDPLLIISIAFNKDYLISAQVSLIAKNLKDPHRFVVVDNSSQNFRSSIARAAGTAYIPSPLQAPSSPSQSHGQCMNWAYKNVVLPSSCRYFGFVDHDVLPTGATTIVNKFKNGFVGVVAFRGEKWYLWPGFCFYDRDVIGRRTEMDFRPYTNFSNPTQNMDTGSSNWDILYRKMKPIGTTVWCRPLAMRERQEQPQLDTAFLFALQPEEYNWIHFCNGSGWFPDRAGDVPKQVLIEEYLKKVER